MEITSLQNAKVKYWTSLNKKNIRDQERKFLVEGDHLIKEAKKRGLVLEVISTINKKADYFVSEDIMAKISNQKSISKEAALVKFQEERPIGAKILVLDGIQDPGNLGTIIRSSVAFGFETIILSDDSVDLYNPKVIRATEGLIFASNVLRRKLTTFLPTLKMQGYKIVGSDVAKGGNIKNIKVSKLALVIGSEGQGMHQEVKELCHEFVKLNMNDNCESLNAAVAASIMMYEVNND